MRRHVELQHTLDTSFRGKIPAFHTRTKETVKCSTFRKKKKKEKCDSLFRTKVAERVNSNRSSMVNSTIPSETCSYVTDTYAYAYEALKFSINILYRS